MLNDINLMGRLTRDPVLSYTKSETAVCRFSLAVERDFGEKGNKETDFIDCLAWRKTAEFIDKYFQKGSMAIVHGRLQVRSWTDENDNKRKSTEVVVENIYFGDTKSKATSAFQELDDEDGELPF